MNSKLCLSLLLSCFSNLQLVKTQPSLRTNKYLCLSLSPLPRFSQFYLFVQFISCLVAFGRPCRGEDYCQNSSLSQPFVRQPKDYWEYSISADPMLSANRRTTGSTPLVLTPCCPQPKDYWEYSDARSVPRRDSSGCRNSYCSILYEYNTIRTVTVFSIVTNTIRYVLLLQQFSILYEYSNEYIAVQYTVLQYNMIQYKMILCHSILSYTRSARAMI